jgi:hypothetical protein
VWAGCARFNDLFLDTRARWIAVRAHDADDIGVIAGVLAVDLERDGVTRAAMEPVSVTGDL